MMSSQKNILKVSEVTANIKAVLESNFSQVGIVGEVSNVALPYSGHCYLTLKDSEAQIKVVIFKYVHQTLKFKIENGQSICCFGKLSVYSPRGEYQLIATKVEPKGVGALQLAFEQLKKKLEKEGLFDKKHKKQLPLLPERIGVVTSATGAALQDILHILKRRFSNISVIVYPVRVQGEGSKEEIVEAIEAFNRYGKVDVLIVGRGGGSLEDLWAFNEEVVARAIFASRIPIISAVGHEIDFTIADFVSDLRAPTPSAAAEVVVERKDYWNELIANFSQRLNDCLQDFIQEHLRHLSHLTNRPCFQKASDVLYLYQQKLDHLSSDLEKTAKDKLKDLIYCLQNFQAKLEALSPLKVMERGYSVTFDPDNKLLQSYNQVERDDLIITRLKDGMIHSKVTKTEKESFDGKRKI